MDAAYATHPEHFSGDVAEWDSQYLRPESLFVQFSQGGWRTTVGYQQVVWGEAFGAYFADIVNPKDLREGGLGDLVDNRISIPMVNLQWLSSTSSAQLIYAPWSGVNLTPATGSDFARWTSALPFEQLSINRMKTPRCSLSAESEGFGVTEGSGCQGDYGLRLSHRLSGWDLAYLYFNGVDRFPHYQLEVDSLTSARLEPYTSRIVTHGLTLSKELGSNMLRAEVILHQDRVVNALIDGLLAKSKMNEAVLVVGYDLTPFSGWRSGFQVSTSLLSEDLDYIIRDQSLTLVAFQATRTYRNDRSIEMILSYELEKSSSLVQFKLTQPLARSIELDVGADIFNGALESPLGQYRQGSRVYLALRSFFSG